MNSVSCYTPFYTHTNGFAYKKAYLIFRLELYCRLLYNKETNLNNLSREGRMFNKFNEKMDDLYQVTNGKNVILWGWGMSGKFLYLHFKKSNRRIACVIDDGFNNEMDIIGIKSHHVLDYYEPETTTILVTVYKGTEEIEEICHQYGFRDVILIRHMFYEDEPSRELDYYPWLEYE